MKARVDNILQKMKSNNVERNKVISVEDIKKFEQENGIKLPKELVIFYTEISNGCKRIFCLQNIGYGKMIMMKKGLNT